MNTWLDFLELAGPLLPALAVIAFAADVFRPLNRKDMPWNRNSSWTTRRPR
jgi:hypothetical protein